MISGNVAQVPFNTPALVISQPSAADIRRLGLMAGHARKLEGNDVLTSGLANVVGFQDTRRYFPPKVAASALPSWGRHPARHGALQQYPTCLKADSVRDRNRK